jgi:aspartokinase
MTMERIKGINVSSELVLVNIVDREDLYISVLPLLRAVKTNRINSPFVSTRSLGPGTVAVSACFEKNDMPIVQGLIRQDDRLAADTDIVHGVGLLTLYPHHSRFRIVGIALAALRDAGLTMYGMSSSISSLIFVLRYSQLQTAVAALTDRFSSLEQGGQ